MTEKGEDALPELPELAEYDLVRELGRGGTAVVYLARDRELGRDVAVKLIRPSLVQDEEAVQRLEREARTVGKLQHPNIVMLLGTRRLSDGGLALVLQYVPGRSLKDRIRAEGPLPFADCESILRDVAGALAYAHRSRIVHRDLKPENVYLDESLGIAKLADFGIARPWDSDSGLTLPGTAIGTPNYMSPEQVDGRELDGRSDIYSLGLLGYELLTGKQPWEGESLYAVIYKQKQEELPPLEAARPGVPDHLREAIFGAVRKDPDHRWRNAHAFLAALAGEVGAGEIGAAEAAVPAVPGEAEVSAGGPLPAPVPSTDRQTESRTRWIGLGAVALALLVVSGLAVASPDDGVRGFLGSMNPWGTEMDPALDDRGWLLDAGPEAGLRNAPGSGEDPGAGGVPDEPWPFDPLNAAEGSVDGGEESPAGLADSLLPGDSDAVNSVDSVDATPASLQVVSAESREGEAGAPLPDPVVVRVLDSRGAPVPGVAVRFVPGSGSGSADPAVVQTDAGGGASTTWTLGPPAPSGPETQELTARVASIPAVAVRFEARPRPAALAVRAALAVGGSHACSLRSNGTLTCWGGNESGQLGDGSRARRVTPSNDVQGGPFAVAAAGVSHMCALTSGGTAQCWGANDQGQSGGGAGPALGTPRVVAGAPAFSELAVGLAHSCGRTRGGAVYCWGANGSGQLGDGTTSGRDTPTRVAGGQAFRSIVAGWHHTCGLDGSGRAFCWGNGGDGRLGAGGTGSSSRPRPVLGEHEFQWLAAGNAHTCGLATDHRILCWGSNEYGQLGTGSTERALAPEPIALDEPFTHVAAGGVHTCGVAAGGAALCWGRNHYGQLGDGTTQDRLSPTQVTGNARFSELQALGSHNCGRTPGGDTFCWGYNVEGQLGDGTRQNRSAPVPIAGARP